MQDVELERLPQAVGGIIAGRVMSAGDSRQQARQHRELAGQQGLEHPAFCLFQYRVEPGRPVADLPPHLAERVEAAAFDQHPGNGVQPLITRGAIDAGEGMQAFVFAENFFDHHVERLCRRRLRIPDQAAQPLKILCGIAQAVDVIEPQALELAFRDQPLDQAVDGVECAGILHPQSRQRIDVEEAPVVDVAGSQSPMPEPVMLAFEQAMQRQGLLAAIRSGAISL